jgi:hypothetical protein
MGYRHIENLYRNKDIMLFKECLALEKIHGTSAHVKYHHVEDKLSFFHGGSNRDQFIALFNQEELLAKFRENAKEHQADITIYGEAYGGKVQAMKDTYGPNLKFVAFEVQINDNWLDVLYAEKLAIMFGFEFAHYDRIPTTEEAINAAMNADSVQAVRNGMGTGHMREGVVLRPIVELVHPNGGRIICKHKRPEFAEREHTPSFADPEKLKVLEDAKQVADEWVTAMRLVHVLDKMPGFPDLNEKHMNLVIKAMVEDVEREAAGEIVSSKDVRKAIGKKTAKLFMDWICNKERMV